MSDPKVAAAIQHEAARSVAEMSIRTGRLIPVPPIPPEYWGPPTISTKD